MSTRSLTHIIAIDKFEGGEQRKNKLVTMYRQSDGYPKDGHGQELATFLNGGRLASGIGVAKAGEYTFNGAECLAAQVVCHFKNEFGTGGIYLYKPGTTNAGEDYAYDVIVTTNWVNTYTLEYTLTIKCFSIRNNRRTQMFSGTPAEFLAWVEKLV